MVSPKLSELAFLASTGPDMMFAVHKTGTTASGMVSKDVDSVDSYFDSCGIKIDELGHVITGFKLGRRLVVFVGGVDMGFRSCGLKE